MQNNWLIDWSIWRCFWRISCVCDFGGCYDPSTSWRFLPIWRLHVHIKIWCAHNEALTIKGGPIKFFNSLIQSDSAGHSKLVYAIHLVLFTDSQEKKLSFLIDGGVMRVCLMNNDAVTIFFFIFFLLKNKWVRGSERGSLIQQHSVVNNKLLFCLYYSRDIQD